MLANRLISTAVSGQFSVALTLATAGGLLAATLLGGCPAAQDGSLPPTIDGPPDLTVECDGSGNSAALSAWLADVTFTQGCGGATLTNNFRALSDGCGATGSAAVTWTVTDTCGQTARHTATFTIVDTTAPTLTIPPALSVTCGDPNTAAAQTAWLASATGSDACGAATITHARSATPGGCTATITWTVADPCGNRTSASATYTIAGDTTAPTMTLNGAAEVTVECGAPFVDPGVTLADDCDALIAPDVQGTVDTHQPGEYTLTYRALDACGNAAPPLTRRVRVVDTQPPTIQVVPPPELWPPNHRLATFTLEDLIDVVDACEGKLDANAVGRILELYSDEPDNDTGDGNTPGDIAIDNAFTFTVRAERSGGGNGRVYGVRFVVSDSAGNTAEGTAYVHVPHDQSGRPAVDDGRSAGHYVTPG